MFAHYEQLSKQANMRYTHITFDVGAASKAYNMYWNQPEPWSKFIIHLIDFHALMNYFCTMDRIYLGVDSRKRYISLGCVNPMICARSLWIGLQSLLGIT